MPVNLGLSLWFLYNHHLSASVESSDCMLTYHDVLTANKDEASALLLARIAPMMDLIGVQLPSDDQWNKFLLNRLRPDLNRSQASLPQAVRIAINPALLHCCERAYAAVVSSGLDFVGLFTTPLKRFRAVSCFYWRVRVGGVKLINLRRRRRASE